MGDSCLAGGGSFSFQLHFWQHLLWPKSILLRTKLHLPDDSLGTLISINVLEFVAIIVNYAAALTIFHLEPPGDDPYPVIFNEADNVSAVRWANHSCKSSLAGRALGRLFCMLLEGSPLGINSSHISDDENVVADNIS